MNDMTRFATVAVLAALPLFHAGCGASEPGTPAAHDEPVAQVASAVEGTTCVTIQRGTSGNVHDALIREDNDENYGGSQSLTAGDNGTTVRHALLQWDLSDIPPGVTVESAIVTLNVILQGGAPVNAHRITTAWDETTVTSGTFSGGYAAGVEATFPSGSPTTADITALVQDWVSGDFPNHGILLERDGTNGNTVFASSEYVSVPGGSTAARPKIEICYQPTQCTGQPNGTPCDDGNACTTGDSCQGQLCVGAAGGCSQSTFTWEVSTNGGATWSPVGLPNTDWGCNFCTRFYRTRFTGVPADVTFRYASDNEARMFVNGQVVFDDYYVNGVDWCTTAPCCSMCCDNFTNCMNGLSAPFSLTQGELATFNQGMNEIVWQVNQQTGGSGFYNQMTISY